MMLEGNLIHLAWGGSLSLLVLLLFSISSLAVIAERLYTFHQAKRSSRNLAPAVLTYLKAGKLHEALSLCEMSPGSPVAVVLLAGLKELREALDQPPGGPSLDRVPEISRGAMERAAGREVARLERYLGLLATLGNVSPFVGLFGTVLGIIKAFQAMAETGSGGLGTVSAGIAEALVATAAGLFVAIPAVIAYNAFLGKVRMFALELEHAASELLDQIQKFRVEGVGFRVYG